MNRCHRTFRWGPCLALCLLLSPSALAEDDPPREPLRLHLGLRLGAFEMVNSPDSYDAVFGEVMPQLGLGLEVEAGRRWRIALTYDYGRVEGERVLPSEPPISTGFDEELTYRPLELTVAWIFRPEARWRFYAGGGITLVDWQDESQGQSASGSDQGLLVVAGARSQRGKWSWGGELSYSQVPDAIGEGGISRFFDEDDIGGIALHVVTAWRIR